MSQITHMQNCMVLLKREMKHYVEKWLTIVISKKFSYNSTKQRSWLFTPDVYEVIVNEARGYITYHFIAQAAQAPTVFTQECSSHSWS